MDNYQELAMVTKNNKLSLNDQFLNAALGLAGEAGEVADMVKKWKFQGHLLDPKDIANELGDICWYIALMSESIGLSFNEILEMNIEKLRKRYPGGFSAERSINRD